MLKKEIGIIYDLEFDKFLPGGFGYIKERKTFKEGFSEFVNGRRGLENKINFNLAFSKKIDEIRRKREEREKNTTDDYLNTKTNEFFKDEEDSILDIVLLAQHSLPGFEEDAVANCSIVYFNIKENTKVGFLVNKNLASILFPELIYEIQEGDKIAEEN